MNEFHDTTNKIQTIRKIDINSGELGLCTELGQQVRSTKREPGSARVLFQAPVRLKSTRRLSVVREEPRTKVYRCQKTSTDHALVECIVYSLNRLLQTLPLRQAVSLCN
jgi:hypothetical protein